MFNISACVNTCMGLHFAFSFLLEGYKFLQSFWDAMAMIKAKVRLTADPCIGVKDLLDCLHEYLVENGKHEPVQVG